MSKTIGGAGTLWVLDEPKVLIKKVKSAVTDTGREVVFDAEGKPGISNLLTVLAVATDTDVETVQTQFEGKGYGDFKGDLSERVVEFVTPFRDRALALLEDDARLDEILEQGRATAHEVAQRTLAQVYERVGFGTPGP